MALSASSPPQVLGVVSSSLGTAGLIADLAARVPGTAQYTMLLEPSSSSATNSPPGDGYALITDSAGTVTLSGALADGTSFSQSVPVSQSGNVPVYANLYGNAGLLLGWINLSNFVNGSSASAPLWWIKPAARAGAYVHGFTNVLSAAGSSWIPQSPAFALQGRTLVISNGDFMLAYVVDLANNDTIASVPGPGAPTNSLSGSINPKNGLLTVKFGNGNGKATTTGFGTVLQNGPSGGGYFLSSTNAGAILLTH